VHDRTSPWCVHFTRYHVDTMNVGIRELRSNLSSILDAVDAGTVVTITDRGHPRATITSAEGESPIERGIREGWVAAGPAAHDVHADRTPRATFELPAGISIDTFLDEDRRDDR
jgi:prevent-host-death family protein